MDEGIKNNNKEEKIRRKRRKRRRRRRGRRRGRRNLNPVIIIRVDGTTRRNMKKIMTSKLTYEHSFTSTMFVLLVLLEAAPMMWKQAEAAPVKRNDILAGTEFLSVFINGAMAPTPRRRGFRRGQLAQDNVVAESRFNEASIFRISKAPSSPQPPSITTLVTRPINRQQVASKLYPISHKSQSIENNQQSFTLPIENLGSIDDLAIEKNTQTSSINYSHQLIKITNGTKPFNINNNNNNNSSNNNNRKIIGVSVTSSVETATPYKLKVNNNNNENEEINVVTRPPIEPLSLQLFSTLPTQSNDLFMSSTSSTTSPISTSTNKQLNITISESNNNNTLIIMTESSVKKNSKIDIIDSLQVASNPEPIEEIYQLPEVNSESLENHKEPIETNEQENLSLQARKAGRHYDTSLYNQPPKVYEASKFYNKPNIYTDTGNNKIERVYSSVQSVQPTKINLNLPSSTLSTNIYLTDTMKMYREPIKKYNLNERSEMMEPVEENYEVDEAVSVGSNGNVHGLQPVTKQSIDVDGDGAEDNHKVGYVVEGRNYRKYRVEERTSDGFIVGEYGVVSHDDGSLRGVRYTADGTINPRLIYDALMKFLAL